MSENMGQWQAELDRQAGKTHQANQALVYNPYAPRSNQSDPGEATSFGGSMSASSCGSSGDAGGGVAVLVVAVLLWCFWPAVVALAVIGVGAALAFVILRWFGVFRMFGGVLDAIGDFAFSGRGFLFCVLVASITMVSFDVAGSRAWLKRQLQGEVAVEPARKTVPGPTADPPAPPTTVENPIAAGGKALDDMLREENKRLPKPDTVAAGKPGSITDSDQVVEATAAAPAEPIVNAMPAPMTHRYRSTWELKQPLSSGGGVPNWINEPKPWPVEGLWYRAHHKGRGGCDGRLGLLADRLTFECTEGQKDIAVAMEAIDSMHQDGVITLTGHKYHFEITGMDKSRVEQLMEEWLYRTHLVEDTPR